MCNPRRVEVTATRHVQEAWVREVRRVAEVVGGLTGEARIVQPLDDSVGGPALMAVRMALHNGFPGWEEQADGTFRFAVEGGYGIFHPDDNTLEIVAVLSEELRVEGSAETKLSGNFSGVVEAVGEGRYYHDGWGGHTEDRAREQAQRASQAALVQRVQERLTTEADQAEQAHDATLRTEAQATAGREWEQAAAQRREELTRRANRELTRVGVNVRLGFHRLLAVGYREALLALARRRGVRPEDIHLTETDGVLEIELTLPD